jgi:hypothetical protein
MKCKHLISIQYNQHLSRLCMDGYVRVPPCTACSESARLQKWTRTEKKPTTHATPQVNLRDVFLLSVGSDLQQQLVDIGDGTNLQ